MDHLLGEELQAEKDKRSSFENSGIGKPTTETVETIEDGSRSGEITTRNK